MKQLRMLSYLVFLSFFSFCSFLSAADAPKPDYCMSGVEGCKCGKPKPPSYYAKQKQGQGHEASKNVQARTEPTSNQKAANNQKAAKHVATTADKSKNSSEKSDSAHENVNKTVHKAVHKADYATRAQKADYNRSDVSHTAPMKGCMYGPTCELGNGVVVRVKNPQLCMLGEQYTVEYDVLATSDVNDVILKAEISENSTYVSSLPEAKVSRKELTWNLGGMKRDQKISGRILLKSEKEGDISTNFNVIANVTAACSTLCAKASMNCESSGPAEVSPGEHFHYSVTVANNGSYPAQDVVLVVTDNDETVKPASFNLGTIEPGKTKKTSVPVTALKRGKISYTAVATSTTANKVSTELATLVTSCSLELTKKGPTNAFLGQKAPYQISVHNTGDRDLHDVVVTETVNSATSIVSADDASIGDKKAVWRIPVLKAGETVNYKVALTTRTKGTYTNTTTVSNRESQNYAKDTNTSWKGHAALDMSMNTSENSIFVGETTRYKINVTNQGQEIDSNVTVSAVFPDGLEPVTASGDSEATITGHTVNFAAKNLNPRQSLEHYVTVKATKQGDLRPKVLVSSDSIKPAITQEESLIVN
jgi:uncharacterized repeat protein (TIGR01451 family)